MNLDGSAISDFDVGNVHDDGTKALKNGDPAPAAGRQRRSPARFLGRKIQGSEVARLLLQKCAAKFEWIFLGLVRQFVDERLNEKAMPSKMVTPPPCDLGSREK